MPSYSEFFWVAREVSVIEDHRPASGLLVSGGRNAERGMIALRVQEPTARQEEASVKENDLDSLYPLKLQIVSLRDTLWTSEGSFLHSSDLG